MGRSTSPDIRRSPWRRWTALAGVAVVAALVQSQDRLERLQNEIIEIALLHAVAGDVEGVGQALQRAWLAGVPESWVLTLEGAAHLHDGDACEGPSA